MVYPVPVKLPCRMAAVGTLSVSGERLILAEPFERGEEKWSCPSESKPAYSGPKVVSSIGVQVSGRCP